MTGDEVVERASALYAEGRLQFCELERWISKGVNSGAREVPEAIVYLPLPTLRTSPAREL